MSGETLHRTAITRLDVSDRDCRLLERTIDEWRRGCQIATDMAWDVCYQPGDVQSLAYDRVREKTNLKSQHAILATHQAAEAIQGCVDQFADGKSASKPEFTAPTVVYDSRTMTLFDDGTVSLTTVENRVRCELVLPDEPNGYQQQFLNDDAWSLTESTLTVREGEYYLHLGFKQSIPVETSTAEDGTVLGVDLGVENLAVTSTARFFSGRKLLHERREFEKRRAELQRQGTRSARKTLDRISHREQRFAQDVLHRISKAIVEEALAYDCTVIALENLTEIQDQIEDATWFHLWAFRRLSNFIEYKARAEGIHVAYVKSKDTSRRCADCGYTAEANRCSRTHFSCDCCGSQLNADYNAAKNIGLRYVRRGPQSSRRTGASRCALKSGTVTPNGGFTAYPDGVKAESADKSR